MLESMYYLVWIVGFVTFFAAILYEQLRVSPLLAIYLHIIAVFFFFLAGVGSISIDVVTASGVVSYAGNGVFGFVGIIFAMLSGALALRHLPEAVS